MNRLNRSETDRDTIEGLTAYWEERKGTDAPLLKLEEVIVSHHGLGSHPNVLLRDESDNLYLENGGRKLQNSDGDYVICIQADPLVCEVPITAIRQGQLEPVSIREALEWYAMANKWMDGYNGDPEDLCRLAAKKIKDLEKLTAN